ncbi:MAG: Phosphoserine phosphatase RsbU [Phycisphaerae bacterium]|nr:Phosphoserine phosphatase RsbU [Phycisphaerae bacterium]
MSTLNIDPQRFYEADSTQSALENVLGYVNELQQRLDQVTLELDTMRIQETRLTRGLNSMAEELEQARRFQLDLLPKSLPYSSTLQINTLYLPAQQLSGDIYYSERLDDECLVINLSDCTGHGVAAALMSVFINHVLRSRLNGVGPTLAPDELLTKLNDELIDARLSECQFVTSLHAHYYDNSRRFCWARGGIPYPILIRPGSAPRLLNSEGGLIGVFNQHRFEQCDVTLEAGDLLLLYTDGLEALLLNAPGGEFCTHLLETPWMKHLCSTSLESGFQTIRELVQNLPEKTWPIDDITILALQAVG